MKSTIECYIIFIFIALLSILSALYIGNNIYITGARNFHAACISQIESSNYSSEVMNKLKNEAKEKYGDGVGEALLIEVVKTSRNKKIAKVTLNYSFELPIFGIKKEYQIIGVAR